MKKAVSKVKLLLEALPYIKDHHGKIVVIKYGGNAMVSDELSKLIMNDVVLMHYVGMHPIIVHGGGPYISETMRKRAMPVVFKDGLRVTTRQTMAIVRQVLMNDVNAKLVRYLKKEGGKPFGISGEYEDFIQVTRHKTANGEDIGFVGDVKKVKKKPLLDIIKQGGIPVIASIGVDKQKLPHNINADAVAGEVAGAIGASKIIVLTNVQGLYADFNTKCSLISELTLGDCKKQLKSGSIGSGMIPKIRGCIRALENGVERAHILDGRIEHALLLEIFTDKGIGTMIVP